MSEKDNLHDADGNENLKHEAITTEKTGTEDQNSPKEDRASTEKKEPLVSVEDNDGTTETVTPETSNEGEKADATPETETETTTTSETTSEETPAQKKDTHVDEIEESNTEAITAETPNEEEKADAASETEKEATTPLEETPAQTTKDTHVDEIEESNAEDAEDESNVERHTLEDKDYHAMSMEQLADEFENLLKNKKVQTVKSHIDEIKTEFNSKFSEILEEKKEEFLSEGGSEIDFFYSSPLKKRFNALYKDYKNNLTAYYKTLETNLKSNLENRLRIIEDIKGLINVEENINTTYKHFKDLQEEWRIAGPIPRDKYNNAWNTYHHHVEIFYDFLHLNRDLRDMDFKHNLDQKLKIIDRAEELAKDDNSNRAFRELQVLHKMWKEDLGPVDKEHREAIWERFSNATKTIHDKRQAYYANVDKAHEGNLEKKEAIIAKIEEIAKDEVSSHQGWQNKIKVIEGLRTEFFNAGKVPIKVNEATWAKFKGAVRTFNKKKNTFYKGLKKDQYTNLQKKLELIKTAEDNKDSDDFDTVTPLMKNIQNEWKNIGHVPRKDSDKIWKRFKAACNHYFDKLNAERNAADKGQTEAFEKKAKLLDNLKELKLSGVAEQDLETIKQKTEEWNALGPVPQNKRFIEGKFNKMVDSLFNNLKMDKSEVEMIKFENKLEHLSQPDDTRLLDNEHHFIRKKIDELRGEINQLENNLQFFSNIDKTNPLVKDVLNNIENHKENLAVWEEKFKKLK
ncbi:chromosome segregation protein, partial [Gelidibacter algens]